MERNGSKLIICPWLDGDVLAKVPMRQKRRKEVTKLVKRLFVKHKFNKIAGRIIDWWMEKLA